MMGLGALATVARTLAEAGLLLESRGDLGVGVSGACQDSRTCRRNELFLAWSGMQADAHDHLVEAVTRGAAGAVVERWVDGVRVPQLLVTNGRRAAALTASLLAGRPDRELLTVGVTGTNGKTTTSLICQHLLGALGPAAAVGTVGVVGGPPTLEGEAVLTTPGPVAVADTLRRLVDSGRRSVVFEASSHALDQWRLDGVEFNVGVFTNLTRDHFDYHGDSAGYLAAKERLADLVAHDGTLIINADDPAWRSLRSRNRQAGRTLTYSLGEDVPTRAAGTGRGTDEGSDVLAKTVTLGPGGSAFAVEVNGECHHVNLPLPGRFNVSNALAALAVARVAGIAPGDAVARLASVPPVPGRVETIATQPFWVVIDFAHTPDALTNVLTALRPLTPGRLIVVFGAGGERDPGKRAPMAQAVARVADLLVLTSDNPRSEDPERIIDDLERGLRGLRGRCYERQSDRQAAIELAIARAQPQDTVLLAGKGHESYQILADGKHSFDERVIALDALRATGKGRSTTPLRGHDGSRGQAAQIRDEKGEGA